jgi:beta-glucosidase
VRARSCPTSLDRSAQSIHLLPSHLTGPLKEELGFEGIVLSDWYLITDHVLSGEALPARAWGVEHYSELERTRGVLDAGCDQFGGEVRPELLVQLVEEGKVSMDSKSHG